MMGELLDLPIAFAFSAGMVATVNPCGFAMLPAYVAFQLGADEPRFASASIWARAARALTVGVVATLGFVLLFATIGAIVSLGGRMVVRAIPWVALLIGLGLVVLGFVMLAGRGLYVSAFSRFKVNWSPGWRGVFLFGLAYGLASLSCTLPIFLVVVGSSVATAGIAGSLGMFVAYAMGMGSVLTAVTIGAALFKGAVARFLKRVVPYVERASAVLLISAGLYITVYWASSLR